MKKALGLIIILALAWFVLSQNTDTTGGDTSEAVFPAEGESIKIGLSIPLTGGAASIGEEVLVAAQYAVDEVNNAGGVNGHDVELLVEDDMCSTEASNSFSKLVNIDGVSAMIGFCSPAVGAGLPIADRAGVPLMFAGSAPGLAAQSPFAFRNYPSDEIVGKTAAEYAYNELGLRKAAVLNSNNDWGIGLTRVFTETFEALGGEVLVSEAINETATDLRTEILKVQAAEVDSVFMPLFPQTAVIGMRQLKELGVDVPILSGDVFNTPDVLQEPDAEGVILAQAKVTEDTQIIDRIEEATGKSTNAFGLYLYDSVNIFVKAMRSVGIDGESVQAYIMDTTHAGAANAVTEFDQDGEIINAETAIYEIRSGEIVLIQ